MAEAMIDIQEKISKLKNELEVKQKLLNDCLEQITQLSNNIESYHVEIKSLKMNLDDLEAVQVDIETAEVKQNDIFEQENNLNLLKNSYFFDRNWYLKTYTDVSDNEDFASNPELHYLLYGGFEGRNPCVEFDSSFYIQANSDVAESGINPLIHYIKYGKKEGRNTSGLGSKGS